MDLVKCPAHSKYSININIIVAFIKRNPEEKEERPKFWSCVYH